MLDRAPIAEWEGLTLVKLGSGVQWYVFDVKGQFVWLRQAKPVGRVSPWAVAHWRYVRHRFVLASEAYRAEDVFADAQSATD